jgi:uncharacterized protein
MKFPPFFKHSGDTVRVLSIDGGGVRGIIPALVLKSLQTRLTQLNSDAQLWNSFDLIAGTSTGILIALGLTKPRQDSEGNLLRQAEYGIDDIIDTYRLHSGEIFPHKTFRALRQMLQAFGEKYDATRFDHLITRLYGQTAVRDALTNLVLTAYDTEARRPFFFKRRPEHYRPADDLNFRMRDAARAGCAAPTFFEPAYVSPLPPAFGNYCLVDGAIFANNPAMVGYIEARKLFPRAQRFVILSLGTGSTVKRFTYHEMKNWGYIDWVSPAKGVPISSIAIDGQVESVNYQLRKLAGVEFHRLDTPLIGCSEEMDDAGAENMNSLQRLAEGIIHSNDARLETIARTLVDQSIRSKELR